MCHLVLSSKYLLAGGLIHSCLHLLLCLRFLANNTVFQQNFKFQKCHFMQMKFYFTVEFKTESGEPSGKCAFIIKSTFMSDVLRFFLGSFLKLHSVV